MKWIFLYWHFLFLIYSSESVVLFYLIRSFKFFFQKHFWKKSLTTNIFTCLTECNGPLKILFQLKFLRNPFSDERHLEFCSLVWLTIGFPIYLLHFPFSVWFSSLKHLGGLHERGYIINAFKVFMIYTYSTHDSCLIWPCWWIFFY